MGNPLNTRLTLLVLILLTPLGVAAQHRFVSAVQGTYDFDGDGLSEFLSLEKLDSTARYSTLCTYYEIDELGEHTLLWSFVADAPLCDAAVADLDGDSSPEIVVLSKATLTTANNTWLRVFPWKEGVPVQEPIASWGDNTTRPTNLTIVDLDNDNHDEIAIGTGSPQRGVILLSLSDNRSLETKKTLSAGALSTGFGQLLVSAADYNNDSWMDLIAVSEEPQELRLQFFLNDGGTLTPEQATTQSKPAGFTKAGILQTAISRVDTDLDGTEEILLPYRSGPVLIVELNPDNVGLHTMEQPTINLFTLPDAGMESADINEILLARAETGANQLRARKIQLLAPPSITETALLAPEAPPPGRVRKLQLQAVEELQPRPGEKILAEEPTTESVTGIDTILAERGKIQPLQLQSVEPADSETEKEVVAAPAGETAAPADLGKVRELQLEALQTQDDTLLGAGTEVASDEVEPHKVRKVTLTSIRKTEAPPILPEDRLPEGMSITDTVYVGEEISWPVINTTTQQLRGFTPEHLPSGALFNPAEKAVTWTPEAVQLGIRRVSYSISYTMRGEVEVEEIRGQSVTAHAKEGEETIDLYFYVTERGKENEEIEP